MNTTLTGITFVRETDAAVLIETEDTVEPVWIPLSQVEKMVKSKNPQGSSITLSTWIARKKGLIE